MPGRSAPRAEMGRVASGHVNRERELLRRAKLGDQPFKRLRVYGSGWSPPRRSRVAHRLDRGAVRIAGRRVPDRMEDGFAGRGSLKTGRVAGPVADDLGLLLGEVDHG